MALLRVEGLPDDSLAAAAEFHARIVPLVRDAQAPVTLLFAPAAHDHADWRRAAVASLARAMAPARVNGLVSDDEAAIAAALAYLDSAAGVTGHLLPLDGEGAGPVV